MTSCSLSIRIERWPLAAPFQITGYLIDTAKVVIVTIADAHHEGVGEAAEIGRAHV